MRFKMVSLMPDSREETDHFNLGELLTVTAQC